MKEPDVAQRWIAAGTLLAADPAASISCPVCGQASLNVTDVAIMGSRRFERVMSCPKRGAHNALLMNKID